MHDVLRFVFSNLWHLAGGVFLLLLVLDGFDRYMWRRKVKKFNSTLQGIFTLGNLELAAEIVNGPSGYDEGDWRALVPEALRSYWNSLSFESRLLIYALAKQEREERVADRQLDRYLEDRVAKLEQICRPSAK
jgi:hypothetical protein